MQLKNGQKFSDKYGTDARINELIKEQVIRQTKNNELTILKMS